MAAAALRAILAQMPIVLVMAGIAFLRHFLGAGRLSMAVGALQFAVRTEQRKVRIPRVIERPQAPVIRRVARLALVTQTTLVHILARVTAVAGRGRGTKSLGRMALHATNHAM